MQQQGPHQACVLESSLWQLACIAAAGIQDRRIYKVWGALTSLARPPWPAATRRSAASGQGQAKARPRPGQAQARAARGPCMWLVTIITASA
jgi:hypothetical protein